jgi:hypothetical protein
VITATAIARIVVVPQRLNERTGDGSGDRQLHLIVASADLDRTDRASCGIKGIDPVDEVPESSDNIMKWRGGHASPYEAAAATSMRQYRISSVNSCAISTRPAKRPRRSRSVLLSPLHDQPTGDQLTDRRPRRYQHGRNA